MELQPAFFIGEFRTTCLPLSRVTNAKVQCTVARPNEQDACERADYQIRGHFPKKWVCSGCAAEHRPTCHRGYYHR